MMLNRRFTPFGLLMISINGMVGSAWLFAPLYAAKISGSAAIIAWLVGGAATIIIALTFAELSVLFPVAGGTAQIPQLSHGTFTSFVLSWVAWLSALTMAPIEVQAILQYASTYFTSLTMFENGVPVLTGIGLVWATLLMLAFCMINIVSYKGLMRFNFLLFFFKVAVIIIAIIALMKVSFHSSNFTGLVPTTFSMSGWQAILTAVASGGVAFAFTGFKHGVELAGETKRSALAIPLAIVGSVACCLVLYIGLQVAFIGALHPSTLSHGWAHVSFVGDVGPFAGLAAGLGLAWLVKLLYIDAAVSPSGAGLIYVTSTARILYAMSQIGYVPRWLSYLNKQHFPVAAIMVNFVLGMFLFLPLPGWQAMVSFLVSGMVISYAMGPIALLCMRIELPNEKRHFRLPAATLICLLAFYFCNLLSYWTGWDTIYKLSIAMGIGIVFFIIACLRGRLAVSSLGIKSGLWIAPYFGGLVLISYLGAFGGKNVIPFGWDFVVIGIFSAVILYIAVKNRAVAGEKILEQSLAELPSV
ncbi:APC family permease [Aquicella lusitana]|uniref:Amino acid/polyamine/organocation transporter (APC superfamily) n=1 Tax=Aquicella lusitana TaxID=254246 RepID=A0A370GFG3_9COXI|nr:APC family permease [Aquicella lusitana]RDI42552.1 amino acid/polyamine/organocation transporter (APC superfamily) [Aquicella lusitana]VVC74331.1 Aspartate-proton symporter [Aquicella lusitana]